MISSNSFLIYNKCKWNVAFMTMISRELKYYGGKNDEKLRVKFVKFVNLWFCYRWPLCYLCKKYVGGGDSMDTKSPSVPCLRSINQLKISKKIGTVGEGARNFRKRPRTIKNFNSWDQTSRGHTIEFVFLGKLWKRGDVPFLL